jgi:hypothetical protein
MNDNLLQPKKDAWQQRANSPFYSKNHTWRCWRPTINSTKSKGKLPNIKFRTTDIKETHVFSSYQPFPRISLFFPECQFPDANLPHPDGNRFMGKTLRRFQRSGSKVQRLLLKVSFQCRRVSSHLWPSIKLCQALRHVNRQQWQSIARFSLSRTESAPVLSVKPSFSYCSFLSAYSDETHSRCPEQKLNFTTGDGFSRVIILNLSQDRNQLPTTNVLT